MKPADRAIATIEKYGSSEDFTIKEITMRKMTKVLKNKFMCQCCKDYFLPHFLDIDHILGRKKITKDKELQKINYLESRSSKRLASWINKHLDNKIIFKHFQILCHNCNRAKFLYKTCPHQQ